ncbi:MAG: hypothetical protein AB7L13_18995 [Acidimicrobiia bacterium]
MQRRSPGILSSVAVLAGSLVAAVAQGQAASAAPCSASGAAVVNEVAPPAGTFHAVSPTRLLDTRSGLGAPSAGRVDTDCVARVELSTGAVPSVARAVALSITTVDAATQGFVSAYSCGSPRPYASNVNLRIDDATPNLVVVPVDQTFTVCLYASAPVHLVADVTGWFGEGDANFAAVSPTRVLDTRTAGTGSAGAPIAAGTVRALPLAGSVAAGVNAVAVNVTATEPEGDGYVTAFPCGASTPTASNVNYRRGQNRSVQALVGLGTGQSLCIFSYATAHVVVDL